MKKITIPGIATILLLSLSPTAHADVAEATREVKEAAIEVGHSTAKLGRKIGHATVETARAVGHATADAARTVGHGAADAARSGYKAVKDAVQNSEAPSTQPNAEGQ